MNYQQQNLPQNTTPIPPTYAQQANFDPLHVCNVTNVQQPVNFNPTCSPVESLPLQMNPLQTNFNSSNSLVRNPLDAGNPSQMNFNSSNSLVENPLDAGNPSQMNFNSSNSLVENPLDAGFLQFQALRNAMQQSQAGPQTPSHISVNPNALAVPQQSPQNACIQGVQPQDLSAQNQTYNVPFEALFSQIEANEPDFFAKNPVRAELKDYICQNCGHLHSDEISKILDLARNLENQAVESFKSAQNAADADAEKQKLIQDANRAAISKLSTNSCAAKTQGAGVGKIFTRAQIGAMTPQEFKNNRAEIFAQYSKGLIR